MTPHELVETRRRQSAGEPKVAFSQEEAERIERALAQAAALRTRMDEAVKALSFLESSARVTINKEADAGQHWVQLVFAMSGATKTLSRLQSEGGGE